MIEIKDLWIQYSGQTIAKNINLKIQDGDFLAIIGDNGSGKSSLLKNILRITKPSKGEIYIDGITNENFKNWTTIGYVAQKNNLNHDITITVREYLNLYSKNKNKLANLIKEFEISQLMDNKVNKLSGGQFQKINIIKVLLGNIKYLILDEPNVNLDYNTKNKLYETLKRINDQGITIIIVTHLLEDIDGVTQIYNMKNNEIESR